MTSTACAMCSPAPRRWRDETRPAMDREVRPAHPRGLWRDRDGAGDRHQYADAFQGRARSGGFCRASASASSPSKASPRAARLYRRRTPTSMKGLSERGRATARSMRPPEGLVRHRRHRRHRCRRLSPHPSAAPSASPRSAGERMVSLTAVEALARIALARFPPRRHGIARCAQGRAGWCCSPTTPAATVEALLGAKARTQGTAELMVPRVHRHRARRAAPRHRQGRLRRRAGARGKEARARDRARAPPDRLREGRTPRRYGVRLVLWLPMSPATATGGERQCIRCGSFPSVLASALAHCSRLFAADDTPLKIKPGLWEITSQSQSHGMPSIPPEALAHMTPQQARAQTRGWE